MLSDYQKENLMEALLKELHGSCYEEQKDGSFKLPGYPGGYDDVLSDKQANDILEADDPEDALNELLWNWYELDYRDYYDREIVDKVMDNMYPANAEEKSEMRHFLWDELAEMCWVEYPLDWYLDKEYDADLMIDTGDGNYDYSSNSVYPKYYEEKGAGIEDVASLVWLAKTQGYTKHQLEKALDDGDVANPKGFLESVRQEVANETSGMNCLTFLVRMTLRDLIKLNRQIKLAHPNGETIYNIHARPDVGTVKISKKAECGLFDPWNGAGSVLEIELEKDIELPIKFIRSCYPDCHFKWGINSVYGGIPGAWKDVVGEIKVPA